ncbi:hypothetical protein GCM10009721_16020 [Terrabacter tumescens]|uniref:Uncharacterized protein n=1 Tax=Terrabacter tumescens TaxID=60443 RepID=A0ABQ2HWU2_9MICO|nr:hypothetical protein GCM10009721_16020 [Terrabacter tumescens]
MDGRVGELLLELGVLVEDRLDGFEHGRPFGSGTCRDTYVETSVGTGGYDERRPPTTEVVGAGVRETYLAAFLP